MASVRSQYIRMGSVGSGYYHTNLKSRKCYITQMVLESLNICLVNKQTSFCRIVTFCRLLIVVSVHLKLIQELEPHSAETVD